MIYVTPLLLVLATLLIQLTSGVNYVTMPVVLNEQGHSNMMVGLAMSCEIIAMLFFFNALPGLVKLLGVRGSLIGLSVLRAASIALLATNDSYLLWMLGIFCYGAASGMMLVLVQTWLNIVTHSSIRGLIMGLFSSALSCGVALGPLLLLLLDVSIEQRFYLNAATALTPLLFLVALGASKDLFGSSGAVRVRFVFRHAKTILISGFIGGIGFFGLPNFLTLYGIENGLSSQQAPVLLTMFMLGSVFLGMALSSLSDFVSRQTIILICIFTSVVCGVFLSLAVFSSYSASLGLLFVWGGCLGGIYAIGLTSIGDRFSRSEQMSVNMSYTLMDSLGGIVGLVVIGLVMDAVGPEGMTYVFIATGCAFLVFYVRQIVVGDVAFE